MATGIIEISSSSESEDGEVALQQQRRTRLRRPQSTTREGKQAGSSKKRVRRAASSFSSSSSEEEEEDQEEKEMEEEQEEGAPAGSRSKGKGKGGRQPKVEAAEDDDDDADLDKKPAPCKRKPAQLRPKKEKKKEEEEEEEEADAFDFVGDDSEDESAADPRRNQLQFHGKGHNSSSSKSTAAKRQKLEGGRGGGMLQFVTTTSKKAGAARPPSSHRMPPPAAPPPTRMRLDDAGEEEDPCPMWTDKHAPHKAEELSVRPQKVGEVRQLLQDALAGAHNKKLLVLRGPPGVGKSALVEVLAEELGLQILTWTETTPLHTFREGDGGWGGGGGGGGGSWGGGGGGGGGEGSSYVSQAEDFRTFLRAAAYRPLEVASGTKQEAKKRAEAHPPPPPDGGGGGGGRKQQQPPPPPRRLFVMEELPYHENERSGGQFQAALSTLLAHAAHPAIVIFTEEHEDKSGTAQLERLLTKAVLFSPAVQQIHINPVTDGTSVCVVWVNGWMDWSGCIVWVLEERNRGRVVDSPTHPPTHANNPSQHAQGADPHRQSRGRGHRRRDPQGRGGLFPGRHSTRHPDPPAPVWRGGGAPEPRWGEDEQEEEGGGGGHDGRRRRRREGGGEGEGRVLLEFPRHWQGPVRQAPAARAGGRGGGAPGSPGICPRGGAGPV